MTPSAETYELHARMPGQRTRRRYQGRLFWPGGYPDEVLARLLGFNRACADEPGLSMRGAALSDDADTDEAA